MYIHTVCTVVRLTDWLVYILTEQMENLPLMQLESKELETNEVINSKKGSTKIGT